MNTKKQYMILFLISIWIDFDFDFDFDYDLHCMHLFLSVYFSCSIRLCFEKPKDLVTLKSKETPREALSSWSFPVCRSNVSANYLASDHTIVS